MIDFENIRSKSGYKAYKTDLDRVVTFDILDAELEPRPSADAGIEKILTNFDMVKTATTIRSGIASVVEEFPDATKDTVISLLLDTRGGMRGWPIVMFSAFAGVLSRQMGALGIKHEILSHTTNEWKISPQHAAELRKEREASGVQVPAGRVGSLLHVVWKDVEKQDTQLANKMINLGHRGFMKENVDGEAIEWAYGRLAARSEPHKLLLTIKYAALDPISEATRTYNGSNISLLPQHLLDTVTAINEEGNVKLSAVILDQYKGPNLLDAQHKISNEAVRKAYGTIHTSDTHEWDDVTRTVTEAVCQAIRNSWAPDYAPAPVI